MRSLLITTAILSVLSVPAYSQESAPVPARKPLEGRAELNVRAGSERSILMNEFWVPLAQDAHEGSVLYGDLRLMGDDRDNREFNIGLGYRQIVDAPVLGTGVAGVHGWLDRRITERGSRFNQVTAGAEWSGEVIDLKLNAYMPVSDAKAYSAGATASTPYLAGSGIFYDVSTLQVVEEPQKGFDLELGWTVPRYIDGFTDSTRLYAGGYHFEGDKSGNVTGWRARIASDITSDIQIGARFQKDDERGSQGFLEATIRFPFDRKKSYREEGLYARLDESPERDIDIVTGATAPAVAAVKRAPVVNEDTGQAQRVIYVDNSVAANGDGSLNTPFDNLTDAQAALQDNDILYISHGTGDSTNMDSGFTLARSNVQVIGEGSDFSYAGFLLRDAGNAPVLTNAAGDGLTVSGANALVTGLTVNNTTRYGIFALADGNDLENITISNVTASGNGTSGVYVQAINGGTLGTVTLAGILTENNVGSSGVAVVADGNGFVDTVNASNIESNGNGHYGLNFFAGTAANGVGSIENISVDTLSASGNSYAGLFFRSRQAGSGIANASARNITSNGNITTNGRGIYVQAFASGTMGTLDFENITATGNVSEGIRIETDSAASQIGDVSIRNAATTGSSGAAGHGVHAMATNGATVGNLDIENVTATGNAKQGIYIRATTTSSLSASVESTDASGNTQHGIAVYDDTSGTFDVDLGGGGQSDGNNILTGNALEDLALDYDGRTISAMNNWWGQAGGPDQDDPSVGIAPQIYYGAPIEDGLVGHWTFDDEWTTNTTVYDRIGGNNGTFQGGMTLANQTAGQRREALVFDGVNDWITMGDVLDMGTSDFSLVAWAKSTSVVVGNNNGIIYKKSTGQAFHAGYALSMPNGQFRSIVGDGVDASTKLTGAGLNNNAWHHAAGVVDNAATNNMYIDGAISGGAVSAAAINNIDSATVLGIGALQGCCHFFNGEIDDVRIYNRVLTAGEVAEIHRMDSTSVVDVTGFLTAAP